MTTADNAAGELSANGLDIFRHGRRILHDVSLSLRCGEIVGLLGPNGAGKSTTMQILAGILMPDAGTVKLSNTELYRSKPSVRAQLGYLPEHPPLHLDSTVEEYLSFCAQLRLVSTSTIAAAVTRVLEEFNLEGVRGRLIRNLSQGFRQRVGVAQAVIHHPRFIILDEPSNGLDPNQIIELRESLKAYGSNSGIVLSTHVLSEVQALCDRVYILHEGRIVYSGNVSAAYPRVRLRTRRVVDDPQAVFGTHEYDRRSDTELLLPLGDSLDVSTVAERAVPYGLEELLQETSDLEDRFVAVTKTLSEHDSAGPAT